MKTYLYKGPDSGITLRDKDTSTDVLLRHGKTVELPEGNAAVKTLVAMGHLVEPGEPGEAGQATGEKPTGEKPVVKTKPAKE